MALELPRAIAPRVSIIIPATSTPELLQACLSSLARFGPLGIPFETIVVLNEASPGDEARWRDSVTGLQVVASAVNLGLAGAGNRGRDLASGEFLVLLHDDAEIEPGWLESLVKTAETHPEAGAVGGKVLFPDGKLQNAGMILWRDARTSPPWVADAPSATAFDQVRAVDYCGTSSLLIRAAVWDRIGGLDEQFYPVYYVDVDLSMALRSIGLVVLYEPRSRIRHHQGASGGSYRFRVFVAERNRLLFLEKWHSALESHEPSDGEPLLAIERAMTRAEEFAEVCRGRHPLPCGWTAERAIIDPAIHERRHLERSRAVQKAFIAHLTKLVDDAEQR